MSGALERRSWVPHVTPPTLQPPSCEPEAAPLRGPRRMRKFFWVRSISFTLVFVSFLAGLGPPDACPAASDWRTLSVVQLPQSAYQN